MDSKYVRKTVENLLAELEKNPAIGRRPSPSFMSRYGRPLGLGIALGVSGAAGCGGSSQESKDALPVPRDAYGTDTNYPIDTKDALPGPVDAYGTDVGYPIDTKDALPEAKDALPPAPDAYGIIMSDAPIDTRDALPGPVDAYGTDVGYLGDTRDAAPPTTDVPDAGAPDLSADTQDAQPQSAEVSREVQAE